MDMDGYVDLVCSPIALRASYAVPGTDVVYRPTRFLSDARWCQCGGRAGCLRSQVAASFYGAAAAIYERSAAVYGCCAAVYGRSSAVYGGFTAVYAADAAVFGGSAAVFFLSLLPCVHAMLFHSGNTAIDAGTLPFMAVTLPFMVVTLLFTVVLLPFMVVVLLFMEALLLLTEAGLTRGGEQCCGTKATLRSHRSHSHLPSRAR
eukprot:2435842-Rhodomonas_salina.1